MMIAMMPSVRQGSGAEVGSATAAKADPTQPDFSPNGRRRTQAQKVLGDLLDMGVTKGFFGTATLSITFHDGNIQHIIRRIEQMLKK